MIINGFCKEVFKNLPMEFAVEATKLLGVSLEGSILPIRTRFRVSSGEASWQETWAELSVSSTKGAVRS
jgi:hypothetical protein